MRDESVDVNVIDEIRSRTTTYIGVNAIAKIADISSALKSRGISRVLVVTGIASYIRSGAWDHVRDAFKAHDIRYELYCGVTPNPDADQESAPGPGNL